MRLSRVSPDVRRVAYLGERSGLDKKKKKVKPEQQSSEGILLILCYIIDCFSNRMCGLLCYLFLT